MNAEADAPAISNLIAIVKHPCMCKGRGDVAHVSCCRFNRSQNVVKWEAEERCGLLATPEWYCLSERNVVCSLWPRLLAASNKHIVHLQRMVGIV